MFACGECAPDADVSWERAERFTRHDENFRCGGRGTVGKVGAQRDTDFADETIHPPT
jgi:hypothetical protein